MGALERWWRGPADPQPGIRSEGVGFVPSRRVDTTLTIGGDPGGVAQPTTLRGGVAVAVVATGVLAMALAPPLHTELPLGFQPAYGVAFGALLLLPRRWWAWALIGCAGLEVVVHGLIRHEGLFAADELWRSTVALVATPLVAATLVDRGGGQGGGLVPVARLARFLAITLVVGLTVPMLTLVGSPFAMSTRLVAAHSAAVGMLVVAPVMLAWRRPFPVRRHPAEVAAVSSAVVVAASVSFFGPVSIQELTRPYWVVLPMMWAAVRFGLRGGAWSVLVTAMISMWATALGHGPFVAVSAGPEETVFYVQLFVAVVAIATLLMAAMVEDLRDRGEVERRLYFQATHDELTGLPNRAYLREFLDARLREGLREGLAPSVSVLVCGVDNFRVVNDGLGQQAGDMLLVELALRLQACIHPDDTLARVSGDEFAVLTETGSSEMVRGLAMQILDAAERPLALEGGAQIRPSVSIGSACGIREVTAVEALRQADAALHRAKVRGKGRLHCFDDRLRSEVRERLLIEADFLPALAAGEVQWQLQPQVDLRTGRVFGLEALCRWHHPDLGPIPPARFVPVVESMGRASELFLAALERVLAMQRELKGEIGSLVPVSVNLSADLLDDDLLVDQVSGALDRAGVEAGDVWIEVTESAAADPVAERTLRALHELGLRLAVDDFATGWSSMSRLAILPWDALKVDRSFVAPLGAERSGGPHEHMVTAIVALAHSLDLRVVAEGVETPEQLAVVRELGCDVVQGWLFSKAVEFRELVGLIDRRGCWAGPGSDAPHAG